MIMKSYTLPLIMILLVLSIPFCLQKKEEESLTLYEALKLNKPVIAEFYSVTCVICKKVKKELEKIENEYGDRILIVRLDVAKKENVILLANYNRELTVPTLVIFDRKGKVVRILTGYVDYKTIKKYLDEIL